MSRTILLNGATGGLGNILAKHLAAAGHRLLLTGRSENSADLPSGAGIRFISADVRNEDEIQAVCADAIAEFGRVDVLINAAGVTASSMSWKLNTKDWDETLAVNLRAPFLFMREVLPGMRASGFGRIINLSSIVAFRGVPGTAAYAASKSGLEGLTKAVACENAGKGITINNLALGYFDAGMLYAIPEEIREEIRKQIPSAEFGNPNTITSIIDWLISDQSAYCNGQTLHLNGGMYTG